MGNLSHWLPVIHAAAGALLATMIVGVAVVGWKFLASEHSEDRSMGRLIITVAMGAAGTVFYLSSLLPTTP